MNVFNMVEDLVQQQLGKDVEISLATISKFGVSCRTVNAFFYKDALYFISHKTTNKIIEIAENPSIAFNCKMLKGWGNAENLGSTADNFELCAILVNVLGNVNRLHMKINDPGCCIVKITLTKIVCHDENQKYIADYVGKTAIKLPYFNNVVYQRN